jgi:nicotinamidase/pyrazinamidase
MTKTALIILDVQNDFCPNGALPISEGHLVVPVINSIAGAYNTIVATQDWHPRGHVSFASAHPGKKVFEQIVLDGTDQTLWPDHCVAGTDGASLHPGLDTSAIDCIIRKGTNPLVDSYSAFLENDKKTETGLSGYLTARSIKHVFICGLATDFCVYYSAMDAVHFGFAVSVIIDACRGINIPAGSIDTVISDMKKHGIKIITSSDKPHE